MTFIRVNNDLLVKKKKKKHACQKKTMLEFLEAESSHSNNKYAVEKYFKRENYH